MAESAREFFESVESRIDPSRTAGERLSYRFDVDGAGSWHVNVDDGTVSVRESADGADCVISLSEESLLKLANGQGSAMTMFLTGKLRVQGDTALALKLKDFLL